MTPACFSIFVKKVLLHTEIIPSKHVTVEEKLAMLLYWLRGAESYCKIDEVFQRTAANDAKRSIDQKGDKTQDILAAMTFDLRFCYLQTGCEGSGHDQQAWDWARRRDLLIPEGKY
ncbi:BQ5605_C003g02037 [Microbotryum silenes-dioicae]|uniref:BQ5605_C003g02037 protein n=1 Tax=Microbotryum silenes-dioicae TaxID=796604 RepID=A0A2X0MMK4_9BASI|nr:BQ5605_C003g02037 [Microbotryum silenes-dioicae]